MDKLKSPEEQRICRTSKRWTHLPAAPYIRRKHKAKRPMTEQPPGPCITVYRKP